MAKFNYDLPKYCVVKHRKSYDVVYFQVPEKLRPKGWMPTYNLGRTDRDSIGSIRKKGCEFYSELLKVRKNQDLRIEKLPPKGSLSDIIAHYQKSEHWDILKPETRKGYLQNIKVIKEWSALSGHAHISKLKGPAITAFLSRWKDKPRTRKMYKVMLSILFKVAIEMGYIEHNLMRQIRLPKGKKKRGRLIIWEQSHINKFLQTADAEQHYNLGTAVLIAYETGQRMFDIMAYECPRDYNKGAFYFRTSKTDKVIKIRATEALKRRIEKTINAASLLTVNDFHGKPWNKDALSHKFREIADKAGLEGFQFRQLRNSAAIHAERAGLSDAEFEAVFGWPIEHVRKMMREHYGDRDQTVADRAITKLEDYRKVSNPVSKSLIHKASTKREQLDKHSDK